MKTIFNRAKRHLREPHYVVVFDDGGKPDYQVMHSTIPRDGRKYQQQYLQNKRTGPHGEKAVYLINVYGKGKGWL